MPTKQKTGNTKSGEDPPVWEEYKFYISAPGPIPQPLWTFLYRVGAGIIISISTTLVALIIGVGLFNMQLPTVMIIEGILIVVYLIINEGMLNSFYMRYAQKKKKQARKEIVKKLVESSIKETTEQTSTQIQDKIKKNTHSFSYRFIKRFLDITVSVSCLFVLMPLIVIIGLSIKLESYGPVLIYKTVLGRKRKKIKIYKFRTSYFPNEERLNQTFRKDEMLRSKFELFETRFEDRQETILGAFLRRYRLNELPALFSVIKGELSIIGPTPFTPWEISHLPSDIDIIFEGKPGISGYSRFHTKDLYLTYKKRVEKCVEYFYRWSLLSDLRIFVRYFLVIFKGKL